MGTELRLGLDGRRVVFLEGRSFCLACGRRPIASRTVGFTDVEFAERETAGMNTLLNFVHPALGWANRERMVSFKIDAPVCLVHFLRGRLLDLALIVLFAAALVALVVLSFMGLLPRKEGEIGAALKAGLVALPILSAWFAYRFRSKRAVLPCTGRRETRDRFVLLYEGEAPSPKK
jgi:hypothetical protein